MELIQRAIAKARADAETKLRPIGSDVPEDQPRRQPGLFDPKASVVSLNPKALEANRIISWNKWDPSTPAFDLLRTKVLAAMRAAGWSTVGIVSPTEDCGKTTVAINLAFSVSYQMPAEVVVVDFDLRQPQVAGYLGIEPQGDLSSFLDGRGALESYIVSVGDARLRVVPSRESRHNATELLCKPGVDLLLGDLRRDRTGRIGIFDLPPLLVTDDALAVLPQLDCVLMVLAEGRTTKDEVTEALSVLGGTNLLGVVLNGSRTKVRAYY